VQVKARHASANDTIFLVFFIGVFPQNAVPDNRAAGISRI
jgi:hypothetical protein